MGYKVLDDIQASVEASRSKWCRIILGEMIDDSPISHQQLDDIAMSFNNSF